MAVIMSNVCRRGLASLWTDLPVSLAMQRELAPFIFAFIFAVSDHASHPYVMRLMTAALYMLIFVARGTSAEPKTLRS